MAFPAEALDVGAHLQASMRINRSVANAAQPNFASGFVPISTGSGDYTFLVCSHAESTRFPARKIRIPIVYYLVEHVLPAIWVSNSADNRGNGLALERTKRFRKC